LPAHLEGVIMELGYWMIFLSLLAGGAWFLVHAAVRSWRRPERFDSSWAWTRPAPARSAEPLGPARSPAVAPRPAEGATEAWSPLTEHAAAERVMLPLDDVDEWLAGRLSAFDHRLMEIGAATRGADGSPRPVGWTVDEELDAFQRGSSGLQAYRDMILKSSREFTPREHMQLEAMLAAS
jgi:hypothetical protein